MPFIVYQITNTANGKRYVGYTSSSLEERWAGHLKRARLNKRKTKFQNAILKYGADVFVKQELFFEDTLEGAKETEILTILDRNTEYNSTLGGDGTTGHKVSDEARALIRKNTPVKRGEENPMFGRKRPDMAERNKSRKGIKNPNMARKGESNPMYGRSHSEATIQKMSSAKIGMLFSEETKAKQSASAIARCQTKEGKANARSAGRKGAEARWAKHRAAKLAVQNSEVKSSE
jgi:group I intron endonuclease